VKFIREKAFDGRAILNLAVGGVPAVLIAAYIVKSLPLTAMLWLVVLVVLYTSITMLLAARRERDMVIAAEATAKEAGAP